MFIVTLLDVITSIVSHLFFQPFVIEIMIFETISNLLEFPFDCVPRNLFIGKDFIL